VVIGEGRPDVDSKQTAATAYSAELGENKESVNA